MNSIYKNKLYLITGKNDYFKYCKNASDEMDSHLIGIGFLIDDIRSMINLSNMTNERILFYILEGDKLTIQSQNALLKICEKPPKNVTIFLCSENLQLLPTLLSRGEIINITPPTKDDIQLYINNKINFSHSDYLPLIVYYCDTLDKVDELSRYDIKELVDFCKLFIDKFFTVSFTNLFKVSQRLDLKNNDDTKYSVKMFLEFTKSILEPLLQEFVYCGDDYLILYVNITNTIKRLSYRGANLTTLLDMLYLKTRLGLFI